MKNIIISIIVPIYNTEKYIANCIESILKQKYPFFELILINDGSTDNSENICKTYQKTDKRIKYYKKQNGGVSSARNLGLTKASGEWICFIDSDDTVSDSYLSALTSNIPNENCLIFYNYLFPNNKRYDIGHTYVEKENMVKYFIKKLTPLSGPYAKLYSKEIINRYNIKFPEGVHMGEDAIFILEYLNHVDGILTSNSIIYYVNKRNDSLSTKYNNFESEWQSFILWKRELEIFVKKYGKIFDNEGIVIWNNRIGDIFKRCLRSIYKEPTNLKNKERLKLFKSIPEIYYKEYINYYQPKNKRQKFNKFLIQNRLYRVYFYLGIINSHMK